MVNNKKDKKPPLDRTRGIAGCEVWMTCEAPADVEFIALDAMSPLDPDDLDEQIRAEK